MGESNQSKQWSIKPLCDLCALKYTLAPRSGMQARAVN